MVMMIGRCGSDDSVNTGKGSEKEKWSAAKREAVV